MIERSALPPRTLMIDTAGPHLQLGLVAADGTVATLSREIGAGHAEHLFDAIDELFARDKGAYARLERVAAVSGPGSFTGLRIGLAAARGLGLALSLPVLGLPTLLCLSLSGPDRPFAIVRDARRGQAYVQRFSCPGVPQDAPALLALDALEDALGPVERFDRPAIDIAAATRFAAAADPALHAPDALYVRAADAKPQAGKAVPRRDPGSAS